MNVILLLIILVVAGLFLWAWRHAQNRPQAAKVARRVAVAITLAVPFFMVGFFIIIIVLWSGGIPPRDFNATGRPFTIINHTSVPLRASARTAYTPDELEGLRHQGIDIDLRENFITCPDVVIPNEGQDFERQHDFTIPIPRYQQQPVEWPSELLITLVDSLGDREVWLRSGDIDSTMRARMQIVITDSMLQPQPQVLIHGEELPEPMWRKRKGGDR